MRSLGDSVFSNLGHPDLQKKVPVVFMAPATLTATLWSTYPGSFVTTGFTVNLSLLPSIVCPTVSTFLYTYSSFCLEAQSLPSPLKTPTHLLRQDQTAPPLEAFHDSLQVSRCCCGTRSHHDYSASHPVLSSPP